ncbi:hypothetical protein scyTo_0010916 [Scyliorhinus torazame]|uniref:RING-type domain-containing protein n=1 Tax=Scyliorhinus torazame TaxID=75743 RepID=A0A401PD51_SCYTO|nr:hypothetical protein [Scyliorhinus torazame]
MFNCPKCAKEWPWQEVRHLAQLSQEECRRYEEQLGRIMTEKKMYRKCPVCSLYVQRMDAEKLCVQCLPCSEKSKKTFQFCWECQREWKNTDVQSDCDFCRQFQFHNQYFSLESCPHNSADQ